LGQSELQTGLSPRGKVNPTDAIGSSSSRFSIASPELEPPLWFARGDFLVMTVFVYVNTSKQVGDPTRSKSSPPLTLRRHGSRKMTLKA
jgi:hypothetical protein